MCPLALILPIYSKLLSLYFSQWKARAVQFWNQFKTDCNPEQKYEGTKSKLICRQCHFGQSKFEQYHKPLELHC